MPNQASELLKLRSEKIMKNWEARANAEVLPAFQLESLALRDSLPELLNQIVDALSTTIDRTEARKRWDRKESLRIGQKHGRERAISHTYTMDQMIFEYRILREVIVCAIEQAVNDAATQFSETLKMVQERIASSLTHDLRGPITAAKLCAELIVRRPEDGKLVLSTATKISKSMERLDFMISELLDASMIRSGQTLTLKIEECNLFAILKDCADELNLIYHDRFIVEATPNVIGFWSKGALHRIIDNLATNAVKYGSPDSPITITLQQDQSKVVITVHNEGSPISKEDQSILFKEFRRAKSAETQTGWGLGLTVVKGLTEAHQGRVRVESTEEKGTSFIVELPVYSKLGG
jgi:signal transduction histidine kinase